MSRRLQWIIGAVGIVFLMQLLPAPAVEAPPPHEWRHKDFIRQVKPPAELAALIRAACYDCHSYEGRLPWYAHLQPGKYWVRKHIHEGREELNFSLWSDYSSRRRRNKLNSIVSQIKDRSMPPAYYTPLHPEARLTSFERRHLIRYFESLMSQP
ncbi:MAG: heme-binding protein [Thermonema sp.]|uniref:heme-binding domain-containing protein n=1 Tax=Thermonema sp. TaxID=2231181 RepID=UPI0021DDC55E|nr:heme-binding domain-containing protein [Thermonema sp.]GIV39208.1 MAG: heme-binding protein [Thermonema sp.]